jgi:uncharacterized membrane protein YedE/YeeE
MAALIVAIVLAAILGFAAHRASVCTVRAVAEIISSRRAYMFASVGRSVLWVWAVTLPLFWLSPAVGAAISGWQLSGLAVLGGLSFGLGAAINGGCAYSTMTRLADGDGRMLAAITGFAGGVLAFSTLAGSNLLARPVPAPARIDAVLPWSAVLAAMILLWALYEAVRLWRSRDRNTRLINLLLAPRYRLSTAALLIGLPGALLFLLYGPFGYTATYQLVIEGAFGTRGWPSPVRWVLLVAVLAGMLVSTVQRGSFRLDWRPRRAWLLNAAGGALMGFGTALAPGGNDALVMYGIPTLSPYALPTYAALALGVAAGLMVMRAWFGIEARVECRNDTFIADTWTRRFDPDAKT